MRTDSSGSFTPSIKLTDTDSGGELFAKVMCLLSSYSCPRLPFFLPPLSPFHDPPLNSAKECCEPNIFVAFWAENHACDDTKSTIDHLFVSNWNSELDTVHKWTKVLWEFLIIWLNVGCRNTNLSPVSTSRVDGPSTRLMETARPSTLVMGVMETG